MDFDIKKYHEAGEALGHARGSWVIDGNTDSEYCLRILRGYQDGDPEILDMMPNPLSGEWAGESIPEIAREYDLDPDILGDEGAGAFEEGYSVAYWDEVIQHAKLNIPLPEDIAVPEGMTEFFMSQVMAMFESHYETKEQMLFAALVDAIKTYRNVVDDDMKFVMQALEENLLP